MRLPKAQKLKEELEVSHWMEITSGGLELYTSSPSWLSLSSSTLPFLAPLPVERMNWILSLGFSSMHEMDFIWSGTRNEDNIRIFTTITDTKGLVDMSKKCRETPRIWMAVIHICSVLFLFTRFYSSEKSSSTLLAYFLRLFRIFLCKASRAITNFATLVQYWN